MLGLRAVESGSIAYALLLVPRRFGNPELGAHSHNTGSRLVVDDRDGRVVAELETLEDAQLVLEGWARDDGSIPDYLCLVELRSQRGAILATDSSVKIRPVPG